MKTQSILKLTYSVALFFVPGIAYAQTYDQCLFTLDSSASGAISMSGSADVNASSCGVVVDSSSTSALKLSGSVKLIAKYVDLVGGDSLSGSVTLSPSPRRISSQPNPLSFLVPPTPTSCSYTDFKITGSGSSTLNPGTYCNGITISGSGNVTFNSGTYILLGGGLDVSGSVKLSGAGVTFFLTQNSSYSYGPMSVSGSATLSLTAPTSVSSPYYGILFYQDPAIGTGKAGSSVSGSSDSMLEGVLYFPTTGLTYSGSSQSGNYFIIVADTLTITGSVTINGNFPNSRSPLEPPVSVSVAPTSVLLYQGQTQQFTPTVNYSTQGVTWSINPSSAGTISSSGLYTAPASVTAQQAVTVTAISQEDPTKSASATITLMPPISVLISPATAALYQNQTQQFSAQALNTSNQGMAWTVNPSVGTVSSTGFYTAPSSITGQQTVQVIATSQADPTKSASATVTLSPPVAVSVAPTIASLYAGEMQQFIQSVINTSNTAVNWSLNPTGVGAVSTGGLYTPPSVIPSQTTLQVIATSQADTTKSASATVTLLPLIITVTPSTSTLFVSQTLQFTSVPTHTNNTAVTWSVNPSVGTISSNGLYTAPSTLSSQTTVTVTAKSSADSTKSASAMITLVPVAIGVAPSTATLYGGQVQSFQATVTNAANQGVNWSASAGIIDSNGNYTAPAIISSQTTATITATSQADSTHSATATATLVPVSISVSPTTASISAGQTQQFNASVTHVGNPVVAWTLNPSVGTISAGGLFTAPATVTTQQTVQVTATSQADTTKSASATVTLIPSVTISITPQTVSLSASQAQQFAATLPNNSSVNWSISPTGAGTISATGLYTAPSCITVQQAVTVTATGATDSTKSISATVTLINANGYTYQRAITIDGNQFLSNDQSNFPFLLSGTFSYLATTANGGKVQNANGYDIIFTSDGAGTQKLNYEIESYNPVTGQLIAWIQIPTLSSSVATNIYMYYGNSSITASQQNATSVWDSNYTAVYHFANAALSPIQDSTTNGNNGTPSNIVATAGQFGGAAQLNGTSSYVGIPSLAFGSQASQQGVLVNSGNGSSYSMSFEAWFQTTSGGVILGQTDGTAPPTAPATNAWSVLLGVDNSRGFLYANPAFQGGSPAQPVSCCYNDGAWHFVSYTYTYQSGSNSNGELKVYVDGVLLTDTSGSALNFSNSTNFGYFLGAGFTQPLTTGSGNAQWTYFGGILDEVRISNIARSYDWIDSEYYTERSPGTYSSISAENTVIVQTSPVSAQLYPSFAQQFQATVTGTCSQAVTWSVNPVGAGTITSTGFYTAPASVPSPETVTITAQSTVVPTATGVANVSLQPAVSVSVVPAALSLTASQVQAFTATLTNSTSDSVIWSMAPSGVGTLDQNGNYTAPSNISTPQTVTITATSRADPESSGSATVSLVNGSSFTYHRAIEIDYTKVPNTDQENFPVLINGVYPFLATVANGGHVQNPNGYDIIFTSDCENLNTLNYEVESYNPVTGEFVAWVSVPTVSHTADTVIYMSYGNAGIITTPAYRRYNKKGVIGPPAPTNPTPWDSNFSVVAHLGKNDALSTINSTSPNTFNANKGATAVAGIIDGAAAFNGSADIAVTSAGSSSQAVTVSTWFKSSTTQAAGGASLIDATVAALLLNGQNVTFEVEGTIYGTNASVSSTSSLLDGNWHYAVGTYNGTTANLYIDGQLNASTTTTFNLIGGEFYAGVELGATNSYTPTRFYVGDLDESRLSNIVRSSDWIATEYHNQSSPSTFYTVFGENTASISVTPATPVGLYAGQTQQYQAAVLGNCSAPPIIWSITPTSGAGSISSGGLYNAPAAITALQSVTITATSQALSTLTGSVTVTLLPPASVSVAPTTATLLNGQTIQFTSAVANAIITGVTWSVSPTGAGTVSSTGFYTAPTNIANQQTVTVTATSLADPTKSASAIVTLIPGSVIQTPGGTFAPIVTLITESACRRPHVAPVETVSATQFVPLACPSSGPCSATATVLGTVTSYSLGSGDSLSYSWALQNGPAAVQFATLTALSTTVTFTTAGTYTLQLNVSDGVATSFAQTQVIVNPAADATTYMYITPTAVGPIANGTQVTLQLQSNINAFQVPITITGANAQTITVTTNSAGSASITYTGQNAGTDTLTASTTVNGSSVVSNSVPVTWISAPAGITTTSVTAKFFANDGTGTFNTPANQQPIFTQVFPNIDFNTATGTVPNNTSSVSNLTRPFTDVVTDSKGNFAGIIQAQGATVQAGVGSLYEFSAVFTGSLSVPSAGQVTFSFSADDAFIFGVTNGVTRVSGPQTNTPSATPFMSYPVMGGVNQRSSVATSTITVNFPAAGYYAYEVDYAKGGDKNLTLVMQAGGIPIPTATLLSLTPAVPPSLQAGQVQTVQVVASGSDGLALAGLPVTINVTGVNPQAEVVTTDGTGTATFAYSGNPTSLGTDQIQATATVNGAAVYSNIVAADWNSGTNQAPVVSAGSPQTITLPAQAILTGTVTDDGLPNNTLTITWSMVSGPGTVTFDDPAQAATAATFSAPGSYVLQLSASDGALTTNSTVTITVNGTSGWSTGWLASPLDGSTISTLTPIALVSGITLTAGTLSIYPAANETAVTVLSSNTTGTGQIGTFDPTTLTNGAYFVDLRATNSQGVMQDNIAMVHVVGDYKPGRVTATITDLTVPAPGLPIQISRSYDSLVRSTSGDFGYGWNLGISMQVTVSPEGDVTLTVNGRNRTFYFTPPANSVFTYYYTPQYTPEPGLYGSLITTGDNCNGVLQHVGQLWECAIELTGTQYQPTGYQYTDPSGRVYTLGPTGQIQSVQDLNGNTLTVTANGISSSSGLSVPFVRDSSGRITQITDTMGNQYLYSYDTNGNLATVTYPAVTTPAQYQYDPTHLLTKEIDQRGNTAGTSTYYANGQLQSVTDAVGNTTNYSYNTATKTTTVTNPDNGTVVTVNDSYGMPLSVTDPLGRTTTYTYDSNHNQLTVTDPLQKITSYTYDSNGFRTSTTDPLGDVSKTTYNVFGGPVTTTDPLNQTRTLSYDSSYRPLTVTDSIGQLAALVYDNYGNATSLTDSNAAVSTLAYDAESDVTSTTDPLNRNAKATYDGLGHRLTMTDPRGNTTGYAYDALGRLTQTTNADSTTNSAQYDGNGNVTSRTDEQGRTTSYAYDAANRVTQTTYPDSTTTSTTYNWRGQPLTQTDQLGRVTTNVYDSAGQLSSVTRATGTPDASTTRSTYDLDGRKLTDVDPLGNTTTYAYDAASRMISVTNALTQSTTYAYDAAGRKTSVTDALGRQTSYAYDARNRITTTTYPDSTTTQTTYDGTGRVLTSTDQAGKVTTNGYDASGQLLTVTDALNEVTQYTYDPNGNRLTKVDANSHTTTYTYDVLNRLKTRLLPAGGTLASVVYNPASTVASTTDFNGKTTTYSYDTLYRLTAITPDASFSQAGISFTYNNSGTRASMTDVTGTTNYTYDNLDRVKTKAAPQGILSYTYDAAGNLLSLQSSNTNGASVSYAYDALNRLQTVTDNRLASGAQLTTYTYDAVGNVASTVYPNGVNHAFTLDQMNRLTNLSINKGSVLASYVYTYGPAGNKTSADESTGRNTTFNYDSVYRLVQESISGDPSSKNGALNYTVDPVGNRLSLTSSLTGISSTTESYDADDRLTIDTYDPNGNTLTSGANTYAYDFLNRLTSVNAGAVTMAYDGDGNRVAKGSTQYLVSEVNPTGLPQVMDEIVGGAIQRTYTYGLMRVSEMQVVSGTWTPSFYSYDGHNDVRLLTNSAGAITDTYEYDSYGNLVAVTGSTSNVFLYQGEQFDQETSFYYLRARYYNPGTGRFFSTDPITENHPYGYAGDDPVDKNDPTGRDLAFISIEAQLLTGLAAQLMPSAALHNNFGGGVFTPVGQEVGCIFSEVGSELRYAVGLTSWGDCVKNVALPLSPDPVPDPRYPNSWPPGPNPFVPLPRHCCEGCGPCYPVPAQVLYTNSNVPHMSPGLEGYIQAVADAAGVASVTIGFTTNHSITTANGTISRHSIGEAVDIDLVNGQTVLALGASKPVKCIQKAAQKAYEDFGPAGLWKNGLEFSNQKLQNDHENHIHIARF